MKVLIADRDPAICESLAENLCATSSCRTTTAHSEDSVFEALAKDGAPRVLLVGPGFGDGNQKEFCAQV